MAAASIRSPTAVTLEQNGIDPPLGLSVCSCGNPDTR